MLHFARSLSREGSWGSDVFQISARNFSTARGLMAESVPQTARLLSLLSPQRLEQLQSKPQQQEDANQAWQAVTKVEDHPSRSLVERLIADDSTWRSVHDEWMKLVDKKAKWEDLSATLAGDGADKVEERLRTVYSLTPGAATRLVELLNHFKRALLVSAALVPAAEPVILGDGLVKVPAPRSMPRWFVDWCDVLPRAERWAKDSINIPLVIVGAIKCGKSTILRNVVPSVVAKVHPNTTFVPLFVDWSLLKNAADYRTLFRGVQDRITGSMRAVGLRAPTRVENPSDSLLLFFAAKYSASATRLA